MTAAFFLPTTNNSPEALRVSSGITVGPPSSPATSSGSTVAAVAKQAWSESLEGVGGELGTPITLSMRRNMAMKPNEVNRKSKCEGEE